MISIEIIQTSPWTYSFYEFDLLKKAEGHSDSHCIIWCIASNHKLTSSEVDFLEKLLLDYWTQKMKGEDLCSRTFLSYCLWKIRSQNLEEDLKNQEDLFSDLDKGDDFWALLEENSWDYDDEFDYRDNWKNFIGVSDLGNREQDMYTLTWNRKYKMRTHNFGYNREETAAWAFGTLLKDLVKWTSSLFKKTK